ncbi:MAG: hypothetical protein HFE29_03085 [Clostridia bacterium]|jgi:hypothetical protein|nr:hypothetical protein [Clostridia bacterium]
MDAKKEFELNAKSRLVRELSKCSDNVLNAICNLDQDSDVYKTGQEVMNCLSKSIINLLQESGD